MKIGIKMVSIRVLSGIQEDVWSSTDLTIPKVHNRDFLFLNQIT